VWFALPFSFQLSPGAEMDSYYVLYHYAVLPPTLTMAWSISAYLSRMQHSLVAWSAQLTLIEGYGNVTLRLRLQFNGISYVVTPYSLLLSFCCPYSNHKWGTTTCPPYFAYHWCIMSLPQCKTTRSVQCEIRCSSGASCARKLHFLRVGYFTDEGTPLCQHSIWRSIPRRKWHLRRS